MNYLAMTPDIIPKLLKVAAAHGHVFELESNVVQIRRGQFDAGDRWLVRWAAQKLPEATRAQIDHALTLRVDSWTPEQIANFLRRLVRDAILGEALVNRRLQHEPGRTAR